MPKRVDKAILIGGDSNTEWQVPWFLENYAKHGNKFPICFANFGVSERFLEWITGHPMIWCTMDLAKNFPPEKDRPKSWFYKPLAMANIPAKECFWIDTDCEILDNISGLFSYIEDNKLAMVRDKPWSKRLETEMYNSGVVGFRGRPNILLQWIEAIKNNPAQRGDQETLHAYLNPITRMTYITEVPNEYNWLRLQIESDEEPADNAKIIHWTGDKGKNRIRGKMKVAESMRKMQNA